MLSTKGRRTPETVGASKHCPLVLCTFTPAEDLNPYLTGTRKTHGALQGSRPGKGVKHWTAGLWAEKFILLCLRAPSCTTGGITPLSARLLPPSSSEVPQGASGCLYSTPHNEGWVAILAKKPNIIQSSRILSQIHHTGRAIKISV